MSNAISPAVLDVATSRQFAGFLAASASALVVTTYQTGMVLLIGTDPETSRLWFHNRLLDRPMGVAVRGAQLAVAGQTRIDTFVNAHATGGGMIEPVYVPQVASYTGDLDVHDLAYDGAGRLVFANTLFSCLATVSDHWSFEPIWRPRFITRLAPEDRCHLNGLAMRDGAPAFVTAVAATDVAEGWRNHRRDGGVVVDVASGEIAGTGLSMPHSPRWHEGKLWLLNAGTGELGTLDLALGRFEPVTFLPGFLRGLAFLDGHALVTVSEPRDQPTFGDLPLQERLVREAVPARCGLFIVDIASGRTSHWLRLEGSVSELYDVAVLPGARRPSMIGFKSDDIRKVISLPDAS